VALGAPLAGALVTLAGPVSFGCADGVDDVECADGAPVELAAPPDATWPAVGSTACGWAVGTVPVVDEELLDDGVDGWARVADTAPEGRCAVSEGRCALEPHPAASTTTAIAVTPAGRMR
jgi:hypothetical protein